MFCNLAHLPYPPCKFTYQLFTYQSLEHYLELILVTLSYIEHLDSSVILIMQGMH